MPAFKTIPTNVITGFLGVGKTTAILHLLQHKPAAERWAVLVNEFGEVGIDGSVFAGKETEQQGVFIREVPGGCMCCAAGLPMQVALNRLIAHAKPDRLLIEPTGLGHPKEVLAALGAKHYLDILDLHATVTLIDARKIHHSRYTTNTTFNQQLEVGDVIVANKADQYQPEDFPALLNYLDTALIATKKSVFQTSWGALQLDWLAAPAGSKGHSHHQHALNSTTSQIETVETPKSGYLSFDNKGEGFYSRGWVFNAEWVFDARKLSALLAGVNAERVKGVFKTDRGITAYNKADNALSETDLNNSCDSRIECISTDRHAIECLEEALIACVVFPLNHSANPA